MRIAEQAAIELYRAEKAKRGLSTEPAAIMGPPDNRAKPLQCPACKGRNIYWVGSPRKRKIKVRCGDCLKTWASVHKFIGGGSRQVEVRG